MSESINLNESKNQPSLNMGDEVKKAFLNQFAENQNHHQRLFVQFLSVVLIALIAYAYVYTNTSNYVNPSINTNNITEISQPYDTSIILNSFEAKTFDVVKDKSGHILSYAKIHLVSIYLFAQMVLVVLGLTLLHMGYSFRRDQQVIHNIRVKSLTSEEYKKIFETSFTGLGKRFTNYLPNFYGILFFAIFAIQVITYWSAYVYLDRFPEVQKINNIIKQVTFINDFFGYNITYSSLKFILGIPVGILFSFYFLYFIKYNTKVNNIKLVNQLTITSISDRINLKRIALLCLFFAVIKIIFLIWIFSLSLLSSAIISFFAVLANLFARYLTLRSQKVKNISNAIFYFLAALAIFIITIISFLNHTNRVGQNSRLLFFICFITTCILYTIAQLYQKGFLKPKNNAIAIVHQLKQESYFFFILSIIFILISFSKMVSLDYFLSFMLGFWALAWSIRSITFIVDTELERNHNDNIE